MFSEALSMKILGSVTLILFGIAVLGYVVIGTREHILMYGIHEAMMTLFFSWPDGLIGWASLIVGVALVCSGAALLLTLNSARSNRN
jgi:hypothetical protein